jgi:undecaprenyl-diphosphatase
MSLWEAIILAIVEGLTEFLPVSSTGHMIIVSSLMGINELPVTKIFEINIQFGAILSVVVLYWKRFFNTIDFYKKLAVAVIPALAIGYLLDEYIDRMLESVTVVAIMLVLGGIVLIFVDKWFKHPERPVTDPSYKTALIVGFFQCIAMIPGVSRSAASIIGGMTQGMTRKSAAEFSFFLAVPTMFAAGSYKFLKNYNSIRSEDIELLLVGNVVAFLVAMLAIKFFVNFLTRYGFKIFGYYRIGLGILILMMLYFGYDLKI